MSARQIGITTPDGLVDTWLHLPAGEGPWPPVILHTDIRGARPVFHEMAERLAASGFCVLLPNLYYRITPAPPLDPALPPRGEIAKTRLAELRASLTRENVRRDHEALLDLLATRPEVKGPRTGIVGYCLSGAIALHTAADFPDRIVAAASFHGGRLATESPESPHLRAAQIRASVYAAHATDDASMPAMSIAQLEAAFAHSGSRFESEVYAARHGFAVPDSPAFNPESAERHWSTLLTLLRREL